MKQFAERALTKYGHIYICIYSKADIAGNHEHTKFHNLGIINFQNFI